MNNHARQRAPHRRRRWRRRALITTAVVAAPGVIPSIAHAYVDPGAAGFLITTILGSIAAAGYLARRILARVTRWLTGTPPPPDSPPPQQHRPESRDHNDLDGDADSRH